MAIIKKIVIGNTTVYPRTITDAVVDTSSGKKLSEVIPEIKESIKKVYLSMPTREITNEEIDNLTSFY